MNYVSNNFILVRWNTFITSHSKILINLINAKYLDFTSDGSNVTYKTVNMLPVQCLVVVLCSLTCYVMLDHGVVLIPCNQKLNSKKSNLYQKYLKYCKGAGDMYEFADMPT